MKAGDTHAFAKVERVRGLAMRSGVKGEVLAAALASMRDEPVEHSFSVSLRTKLLACNEVIHVKREAGDQHMHHPEASDRHYFPVVFEKRKMEAFALLLLHSGNKILGACE